MKKKITFRVNDELYNQIKEYAALKNMDMSSAVRHLTATELHRINSKAAQNEFDNLLLSLGYDGIKDIPDSDLHRVVGIILDNSRAKHSKE